MDFEIKAQSDQRPHLPKPLLDGVNTTIDFEQLMEERRREGTDMWMQGQEAIGPYFLPPFQRPAVWTSEQQVRFIESALLGVSLGTIVVVDAMNEPMPTPERFADTDRWLLDGRQRLNALLAYRHDKITVLAGTECEHRWSDLGEVERRRVWFTQIGLFKIRTSDVSYCRATYNRLNFGGTPHTKDQRA